MADRQDQRDANNLAHIIGRGYTELVSHDPTAEAAYDEFQHLGLEARYEAAYVACHLAAEVATLRDETAIIEELRDEVERLSVENAMLKARTGAREYAGRPNLRQIALPRPPRIAA